jgi:hypothetical protein
MSIGIWIGIGVVTIVVWSIIIWELVTAPVVDPNDYNVEEEAETRDAPPTNEKSPPKSQTYSGTLDPQPKHWKYPTTDCQCQLGVPVKKHTKDCTWMWENHGKQYQLTELQKRYEEVKSFGSDEHIYQELHRIEREIQILKGKQR